MEMQLDYSVRLTQMPGTEFELWTKKARLGYSGPGFNFTLRYFVPYQLFYASDVCESGCQHAAAKVECRGSVSLYTTLGRILWSDWRATGWSLNRGWAERRWCDLSVVYDGIFSRAPSTKSWIIGHGDEVNFCLISTTILIFNIWMTTYAMAKYRIVNGWGDVYQGDCVLVGRYNTLIHSGINIVSIQLLSSSSKGLFRFAPYSRLHSELG